MLPGNFIGEGSERCQEPVYIPVTPSMICLSNKRKKNKQTTVNVKVRTVHNVVKVCGLPRPGYSTSWKRCKRPF